MMMQQKLHETLEILLISYKKIRNLKNKKNQGSLVAYTLHNKM